MNETCPLTEDQMSQAVRRATGPDAPGPMKMMAARGMAPMPPQDIVVAQFFLTFDADDKIRSAATKSLNNLDARIANAVVGDRKIPPPVLGHLAIVLASNDAYAEKLLLNPSTPDSCFIEVAKLCSEATCELIANNQARVLKEPRIVEGLLANDNALKSTTDRIIDFLVRNSVFLENVPQFEDALLRLSGEERLKAADAVDLPPDLIDPSLGHDAPEEDEPRERRLIDEDEDEEEQAEEEEETLTLEQRLRNMTTGQKIALAAKGNKQVRTTLMRDTNRLVAVAAVSSPMITESEIVGAAQSRTVHKDVILHITTDKKNNWIRLYQVKVALVNNPKTALPTAMKMVTVLHLKDLKTLAKSRNVPAAVRNSAIRLVKSRT